MPSLRSRLIPSTACARARRRFKGFTLIELLVVISIIALLAAILFPVFARVREKARQTSCASNLKQIALAFAQYLQDNDGRYPYSWDTTHPGDPGGSAYTWRTLEDPARADDPIIWPAKVLPYLKNRQIFTCPSRTKPVATACATPNSAYNASLMNFGWAEGESVLGSLAGEIYRRGANNVSYGYNLFYLGGNQIHGRDVGQGSKYPNATTCYSCAPAQESEIDQPSQTLLLIDNSWGNKGISRAPAFATAHNIIDSTGDLWCRADGTEDSYDSFDPRHNGGLNVAFADGHVKWMRKEDALYVPDGGNDYFGANYASQDAKFIWNRF